MLPSAGLMSRFGEASGFGAAVSLIYSLIIDNNQCLSKVVSFMFWSVLLIAKSLCIFHYCDS